MVALFLISIAFSNKSYAQTLTYIESFTATGSFNSVNFTNAIVTFTGIGLAGNIQTFGNQSTNDLTSAAVTVGSTTVAVAVPLTVFVSRTGGAAFGFGRTGGLDLVDMSSNSFSTYFLASSLTVTPDGVFGNFPFSLSLANSGTLSVTSASVPGSFQSTAGAAIPEPASLSLAFGAMLALGALRRRHQN
jgi:hypothetical protein